MAAPSDPFTWTISDPADKSRPAALESTGWTAIVNKPSRQNMNWMFEKISEWITYFNAEAIPAAADAYYADFEVEHASDGSHTNVHALSIEISNTLLVSGDVTVENELQVNSDAFFDNNVTIEDDLTVNGISIFNGLTHTFNGNVYTDTDLSVGGELIVEDSLGTSTLSMQGDKAEIIGQFFKHYIMKSEFDIELTSSLLPITSGWEVKYEQAKIIGGLDGVKTSSYELSGVPYIYNYAPPGTSIVVFNDNGYFAADFVSGLPAHYVSDFAVAFLAIRYDLSSLTEAVLSDQTGGGSSAIVFPFRLMTASSTSTSSYAFDSNPHFSFFRGFIFDIKYVPGTVGSTMAAPFVNAESLDNYPGSTNTTYLSVDATDNTIGYLTIPYSDFPASSFAIGPGGQIVLNMYALPGSEIGTATFYTPRPSSHATDAHMPNVWFFYPALLKNVMTKNGIGSTDF